MLEFTVPENRSRACLTRKDGVWTARRFSADPLHVRTPAGFGDNWSEVAMPSLRHVIRSGWPIRLAVVLVNKALPAYRSRLYTPTFLDRLGNEYILVDCWHHRVLVGTDLNTPIS